MDEQKIKLYESQKKLLEKFLETGAITKAQFDKSFGDLTVKMGMQDYNGREKDAEKAVEKAAEKEYIVYILRCADGTLYTGITDNPERRLKAHNNGTASKYTRSRRPVEMIYKEPAGSKSAALRRELEIKSLPRAEKLALIGK